MTKRRIRYSDFCYKVQFYKEQSYDDDNTGQTIKQPVPTIKAWAKPLKRTRMQTLTFLGERQNETIDIMIPHNDKASDQIYVDYNGNRYKIQNYSPDDSWGYGGYDVITLLDVRKGV